jgi:hypothetical protein
MAQWTGSLVNLLVGNSKSSEPVVGMGVTELCWTDRHAYEIVKVIDDRHIIIRRLNAVRTDNNGMSDCQDYDYYSDLTGMTLKLFRDRKGVWRERIGTHELGSTRYAVGYAEEYYDYSF